MEKNYVSSSSGSDVSITTSKEKLTPIKSEVSVATTDTSSSSEEKKENCKPKTKHCITLSDSSEDESENESDTEEYGKKRFDELMQIKKVPISLGVNNASKVVPKQKTLPEGDNETLENKLANATNLQLVTKAFSNKNGDFDQCIKKFVDAYKSKQVKMPTPILPTVIPPPIDDPSKRMSKKKKKLVAKKSDEPEHPDAHLGGIFTVNNGWDKPVEANKSVVVEEEEMPKVLVPREERRLPVINIVVPSNIDFMEDAPSWNYFKTADVKPKESEEDNFMDTTNNYYDDTEAELQVDYTQSDDDDEKAEPLSQKEDEEVADVNKGETTDDNNNYDKDEDEISISADFAYVEILVVCS